MFHLVTHAFFKALLFLGAGAIILALHHEQDIRKMGGMWKRMPALFVLFALGGLALMGMYPFSGFFSKDAVLIGVYMQSGLAWQATWCMLLATVVLTAFYTTRLIVLVFFGEQKYKGEIHGTGPAMMIPLVILAILSVGGGILGGKMNAFLNGTWARFSPVEGDAWQLAHNDVILWSIGGILVGFLGAIFLYMFKRDLVENFVKGVGKPIHNLVENKFYVDEIYYWGIIAPFRMSASVMWFLVDRILIDTVLVGGTAKVVYWTSGAVRQGHPGTINVGAAAIVLGFLGSFCYLVYRYLNG
jgi:NADH-quinone oxidoreductase subunit L